MTPETLAASALEPTANMFLPNLVLFHGIIAGVFILRIIFVALTMLGVDSSSLYIIKGAIILVAVSLDMRKYLVKK